MLNKKFEDDCLALEKSIIKLKQKAGEGGLGSAPQTVSYVPDDRLASRAKELRSMTEQVRKYMGGVPPLAQFSDQPQLRGFQFSSKNFSCNR